MHYDIIIVGAGSMGMAAGYFSAKKGKKVLLIDAYDPPHQYGSHHGETRIIRHAYGEGEHYVELALRAQELWNELDWASEETLFLNTGVLTIAEEQAAFMQNVLRGASNYSLPIQKLTAAEINRRWKGFSIPDSYTGVFESASGVLMSEACIRAYKHMALKCGAVFKTNSRADAIQPTRQGVEVVAGGERYTASSLILAPGSAISLFLNQLGLSLPLKTIRKTFSWFDSEESLYESSKFPAFSCVLPEETYYGFPSVRGAGVKIGRHDGGQELRQEERMLDFGAYEQDEQDVSRFANRFIPDLGPHQLGRTCTYTNTPDEDFIIDTHPDYRQIVIACGFSGHGFKFSSAVGEILSQLATEGEAELNIKAFSVKRFMK